MENIRVKIFTESGVDLPAYKTLLSAGMDVKSNAGEIIQLLPNERKLIPTGIFVAIPEGFEIQVRSRSGLALKKGIVVANAPGTIDADYRGEIGIIIHNTSNEFCQIAVGERIAQLVLKRVEQIEWDSVGGIEELGTTERGGGGFGHTGEK